MDIKEIKQLIKNSAAVLIMDNGEPAFVVMDFQSYKKVAANGEEKDIPVHNGVSAAAMNAALPKDVGKDGELEILERINKDILALKDEIEKEEKSLSGVDPALEG